MAGQQPAPVRRRRRGVKVEETPSSASDAQDEGFELMLWLGLALAGFTYVVSIAGFWSTLQMLSPLPLQ